jgi:tRNA(Ile)-lysidine synthase
VDVALEREVAARARSEGLIPPGASVLVATSGGADSAALAGLLSAAPAHGLPVRIVLGHVDHGWRGPQEAAADRQLVEDLAGRLGVPAAFAGPPDVVRRTEDDARRFRYRALATLATEHGCALVATAHHLRDQAETLVLRLARGSGPVGLAGIPVRRPLAGGPLEVVRPVLWVDPARLRAYAAERVLPWREDPTNAEVDRDRARVRARLVALGARGAALTRDLARAAERFARHVARREAAVAARLAPSYRVHAEACAVEVSLEGAASLPPAEAATVLRVLGRGIAADAQGPWFTRRHAELAAGMVHGTAGAGTLALPRGLVLVRTGRRLLLARRVAPPPPPLSLPVEDGAEVSAGVVRARIACVSASAFDARAWRAALRSGHAPGGDRWEAALDAEALGRAVTLRGLTPGDRFVPLGRTAPTDVAEFLARQSWPAWLRRGVRVVVAGDGRVAWVVGHRIDAGFAVGPRTTAVARLEVSVRRGG